MRSRHIIGASTLAVAAILGCSNSTSPAKGCVDEAGNPLPVAPLSARVDRKSTRLNSSHSRASRMPSSA